jgi:hypothetical protein
VKLAEARLCLEQRRAAGAALHAIEVGRERETPPPHFQVLPVEDLSGRLHPAILRSAAQRNEGDLRQIFSRCVDLFRSDIV